MPDKARNVELNDLKDKVRDANAAAKRPDAGDREKADLKILEQEAAAAKLRAKRPSAPKSAATDTTDAKLDKALKDSFPGSDPVSFVEAAPLKEGDADHDSVRDKAKDR